MNILYTGTRIHYLWPQYVQKDPELRLKLKLFSTEKTERSWEKNTQLTEEPYYRRRARNTEQSVHWQIVTFATHAWHRSYCKKIAKPELEWAKVGTPIKSHNSQLNTNEHFVDLTIRHVKKENNIQYAIKLNIYGLNHDRVEPERQFPQHVIIRLWRRINKFER